MAAQTDGAGPRDETAAAAAGAGAAGAAAAAGPASEPATAAPLAPVVEGGVGEGARSGSKREHPDGQEESLNIRIACGKASTTVSLHPLTTVAELKKDIESQTGQKGRGRGGGKASTVGSWLTRIDLLLDECWPVWVRELLSRPRVLCRPAASKPKAAFQGAGGLGTTSPGFSLCPGALMP